MILRRAGVSLLVGAILMAPSVASAAPALVFEPYNGTVLYAEDPDAQWFPASLTKLMTAYVTFQALKAGTVSPDTKVVCSPKATTQAPSKLGLPVGGVITLDVALKVLIVKSANDVAVMIAETVAGSEEAFVARMNEAAQHLGMTRTTFTNVNGLPDERQVTTARDLAKLARAIIVEFPEHADLFSLVQVQVGKKTMRTHNSLLVSLPGADGMKTGFICSRAKLPNGGHPRHRSLCNILQPASLTTAAPARRRPLHHILDLRGTALPLLQRLARAGSLDGKEPLCAYAAG